ncbi:hypothetical protein NE573_24405, partial [Parabacteroides distasonis]|nr:hypothetical protein [Parabacteroides distasonis]
RRKGIDYFNTVFVRKFANYTVGGLLLTLIILFSFQGETILNNPLHIALIAVPLVLQTVEQTIAYAELQKALFFCKRKKIPLLFVSIKDMINDIRFF